MIYSETSVESAGKDFVENIWPTLFSGKRGSQNREYMKVRAFVLQTKKFGGASKSWTVKILKEYGGDRYNFTEKIGVCATPNAPALKEAIEKIGSESEGEESETKI